ncbi:MAG: hypothetical protein LBV52_06950 [Spirochaetaceae bacterium]|jgi:hypothetical protein|nr:hypothetical protein [Spirochaetaceae bacterium]
MRKINVSLFCLFFVAVFHITSCKTAPPKEEENIVAEDPYKQENVEGIYWVSDPLPQIWSVPDEIGKISSRKILNDIQSEELEILFKQAYFVSLLEGLSLEGVLGLDNPHIWPSGKPVTWVQNWQSSDFFKNSWGLPHLVLALLSSEEQVVWTVSGAFLEFYSKPAQAGGLNGAQGYGTPCSDVFFTVMPENGFLNYAQRFEQGVMCINNSENVFFKKEEVPSRNVQADNKIGVYIPGENNNKDHANTAEITKYFLKAWKNFINKNGMPIVPDTNVYYVQVNKNNWHLFSDTPVQGFYIQFFDNYSYAAVLPDIETANTFYHDTMPCIIIPPKFLDILTRNIKVLGAENLEAFEVDNSLQDKLLALTRGLALYGLPVSAISLSPNKIELEQRFSKGFLHDTLPF